MPQVFKIGSYVVFFWIGEGEPFGAVPNEHAFLRVVGTAHMIGSRCFKPKGRRNICQNRTIGTCTCSCV